MAPSLLRFITFLVLLITLAEATRVTSHHKTGTSHEGDFVFDTGAKLEVDLSSAYTEHICPVKRVWGVPDMPAYIGRIFHMNIPKDAFSGKILSYKVTGPDGTLPSWLWLDSQRGILRGVPGPEDRGEHRLKVTAIPSQETAGHCKHPSGIFVVEVKEKEDSPHTLTSDEQSCRLGEDDTRLIVNVGKSYSTITPKQRLNAIIKMAKFMALEPESFSIHPSHFDDKQHNVVLMSGYSGGKKKYNKDFSTSIELSVGCNGEFWPKHSILVHQIKQQVLDGTLTDIINLPVNGWKVVRHKQPPLLRKQRQARPLEGSAYEDEFDDEDMDEYNSAYGEEDDYEYETEKESNLPPPKSPPTTTPIPTPPPHHHRHHHGETITTSKIAEPPIIILEPVTEKNLLAVQTLTPDIVDIDSENPTPFDFDIIDEESEQITQPSPTTPTHLTDISTPTMVVSHIPIVSASPSTLLPVEIPIQENEIIPTDTITTLAGTPQMETEDSSTSAQTPEAASTEDEHDNMPITTHSSHSSSSSTSSSTPLDVSSAISSFIIPEDTTSIYTTYIDLTQQNVTNRNVEIVPLEPRKHNEESVSVEVLSTTEKYKPTTQDETIPIIPEYSTTPNSWAPRQTPQYANEEIELSTPEHRITDYASPDSSSVGRDTTPEEVTTTERSSTIIGRTTETVVFPIPSNSPPQKQHRTKKVAVTAGKYFSYIIPEDLFIDAEDGTNLKLTMYDIEHSPLKASSWVQFDPKTREVYGLPLEEHVSKWEYLVEATDSSGASVVDTLDITVQQHKGRRTVNHEFSMKLRLQKKYPAVIDWQIRVLKGLVSLFRDTDMDQITVIEVDLDSDPMQFVWTNDTLPRSECPKNDIDRLMGVLQSTLDGDPSPGLQSAMSPELLVKSVAWKGMGACSAPPTPPPPQPPHHPDNFGPMPRNQIDHINATAGKLLIFKVPEDTFYDPEDGSSRNLKMWLTKGDRSLLSPHNWLQFDTKNQEFFGLPMEKDVGRKEYQLVCEDSGGLTANDGLLVEVHPAPAFRPPVEFHMTLDNPSIESAVAKRKFIEKLQNLFGDPDTSMIKIRSINYRPTVVSWFNTSLPGDHCPEEEIKQLRNILVGSDGTVTERADVIMGADFPVMSVSLVNRGACSSPGVARVPETPPVMGSPAEDAAKPVNADNYLITFIVPIVVIVCMIIIASLIACILYKRRRSGKMDVGDDEEKQAFRPKIPVIFQDELDEKPDPSNKSPVIMKEEKPPLLPPPEYKGIDSSSPTPSHTPYHPPPPFTASRDTPRNNRPKPSPAYRKPPPYVPP